jgi:hypothetical protein
MIQDSQRSFLFQTLSGQKRHRDFIGAEVTFDGS